MDMNTPTPGQQTKVDVVEELNDVLALMIDSHRGYSEAIEQADDSFALQSEFAQRANRRSEYIAQIQDYVRTLGGEPQTSGTARGAVHRGWMKFANTFQDDEKGAISSVENGESFLANRIEDCLEDGQLDANAAILLRQAHLDAKAAENYFDMLEDAA